MREFIFKRETTESEVLVDIGLDAYERPEIITPFEFFTHVLDLFSFHSGYKVIVESQSRDNDPHHLIEDVAITMGICFKTALGDKKAINRYGWSIIPMDEALVMTAIDISGRPAFQSDLDFKYASINDMPADMINHFFESFAINAMCAIHIKQFSGCNDHHIAEAVFKSFAHTASEATRLTGKYDNRTPSSKGVI